MLERPHSAGYIEQQLSFLRVYGDTWIGKRGMVHPLADYVDDPACFKRSYAAKEDRSWEGNAVDFKSVVETVAAIDPRVAAQLALLLAFGLRRKEAVMFMPHSAVVSAESVPTSQHASDRYAVFLKVERGTKGGRLRFVAIRNDDQRKALDLALQFALHPSSHLGHPGLSLKQALKRFDNVMQKAGVARKQLGVTAHGLRHQFAQEFHVELTDVQAPVRGGDVCADPETLSTNYMTVAIQLAPVLDMPLPELAEKLRPRLRTNDFGELVQVCTATLDAIRRLTRSRPTVYLPTHDPEGAERLAKRQLAGAAS